MLYELNHQNNNNNEKNKNEKENENRKYFSVGAWNSHQNWFIVYILDEMFNNTVIDVKYECEQEILWIHAQVK